MILELIEERLRPADTDICCRGPGEGKNPGTPVAGRSVTLELTTPWIDQFSEESTVSSPVVLARLFPLPDKRDTVGTDPRRAAREPEKRRLRTLSRATLDFSAEAENALLDRENSNAAGEQISSGAWNPPLAERERIMLLGNEPSFQD